MTESSNQIIENIQKYDVLNKTRKIEYQTRIHPIYKLSEILSTYNSLCKNIGITDLFNSLSKSKQYKVHQADNKLNSLVTKSASNVNESIIKGILNQRVVATFKSPFMSEPEVVKKAKYSSNYDTISSESNDFINNKPIASRYQISDDSSDLYILDQPKIENKVDPNDFLHILKNIGCMFNNCAVISLDSFNKAYCQVHGRMFNYSTARCGIIKHIHSNLSKYLKCCSKVIDFKNMRKNYIITKNLSIPVKRFEYYSRITKDNLLYPLAVESIICNLFALKSTVSFDDFIVLFQLVYNCEITTYFKNITGVDYTPRELGSMISGLKSPNLIVVSTDGSLTITTCPYNDQYREWKSPDLHIQINKIERQMLSTTQIVEEVNLPICKIIDDPKAKELLKLASLNVPVSIQKETNTSLFTEGHIEIGRTWKYLTGNLNFGNKKFFM